MVDVIVRRASILERLIPGLFEGATLVPESSLNPLGVSDRARRESSLQDMTVSQQVAAAVALEELGYDVEIEEVGVLVSQVAPGSPASDEFEIGDVIIAAEGERIRTPRELATFMRENVEAGDSVAVTVRRGEGLERLEVGTRAGPEAAGRCSASSSSRRPTSTCPVDISIDAGNIGGPSAGLAFALDIVDELGSDLDEGRKIVVTGATRARRNGLADRGNQAEDDRRARGRCGCLRRSGGERRRGAPVRGRPHDRLRLDVRRNVG